MQFKKEKDIYSNKGYILGDSDINKNTDFTYEDDLIATTDSTIGIILKDTIFNELGGDL